MRSRTGCAARSTWDPTRPGARVSAYSPRSRWPPVGMAFCGWWKMRSMADLRMWRDLRRKRREREAMLLDLGALVYELHRLGQRAPELLQDKAIELDKVDQDVRALEDALDAPVTKRRLPKLRRAGRPPPARLPQLRRPPGAPAQVMGARAGHDRGRRADRGDRDRRRAVRIRDLGADERRRRRTNASAAGTTTADEAARDAPAVVSGDEQPAQTAEDHNPQGGLTPRRAPTACPAGPRASALTRWYS